MANRINFSVMINLKKFLSFVFFILISFQLNAQLDSIEKFCEQYLQFPYISDGQQYLALLSGEQTAEFDITFYGGTTYRIIGCSKPMDNSLIFSVYDKDYNLLFSNEKFGYSTYWDIKFTSTITCKIYAKLPPGQTSGFAFLMIGFKQIE